MTCLQDKLSPEHCSLRYAVVTNLHNMCNSILEWNGLLNVIVVRTCEENIFLMVLLNFT